MDAATDKYIAGWKELECMEDLLRSEMYVKHGGDEDAFEFSYDELRFLLSRLS